MKAFKQFAEAKRPGKGTAKIKIDWDHGKPDPGDKWDWKDKGVYYVKHDRSSMTIEGDKEDLITWLWDVYGWDMKDIEREYKELYK